MAIELKRCHACRAPILSGLSAAPCAIPVAIEPHTFLNTQGETVATILTLGTYTAMAGANGGLAVIPRTLLAVRLRPAGGDWTFQPYDVMPAHRCGIAWPNSLTELSRIEVPPPIREILDDKCPF